MLELNTLRFMGAAAMLARLHQIFSNLTAAQNEMLTPGSVALIAPPLEQFKGEAVGIGAQLAVMAADRALTSISAAPCAMTVGQAVRALQDIESRFADYMCDVKMFAVAPAEAVFLQTADQLIELDGFAVKFPSASFEVEEASKCIVLGRHTAAVFHAMRMLEIGIKALSKRLEIPDPTRAAEKNWGFILTAIQARIDELWPRAKRLPASEGAAFEALHATLDAVRNPWRNATMHVETIYAPHEALHILRCVAFFMRRLSDLTDEQGSTIVSDETPPIPGLVCP
jgi:hypothetical protein